MTNLKQLTLISIALGAFVFGASPAHAGLILSLNDGVGHTATAVDGGINDANSAAGVVTFIGAVGNWTVNVTTGGDFSQPGQAVLDLSSLNAVRTGRGASTMTISLTETGLTDPAIVGASGNTQVGGTTDGTVSFNTYFNGVQVASMAGWGTASFGGLDTTNPFSLTNEAKIAQSGAGVTSFDMVTTVPEPVTLGLLGLGLLGLGFARRRMAA